MSTFIPISIIRKSGNTPIKLEELGKKTGFLGLGRKTYLVFNETNTQWGVKSLNLFERILRCFGFFKETHKDVVRAHLSSKHQFHPVPDHKELKERILMIWKIQVQPPAQAPVLPPAPVQVQPAAQAQVPPPAQAPVLPPAPAPVQPAAQAPVLPSAPAPVLPPAPAPVQPVAQAQVQRAAQAPLLSPVSSPVPISVQIQPRYDLKSHSFTEIDPRTLALTLEYRTAIEPKPQKNIENVSRFGDWTGMEQNNMTGPSGQSFDRIAINNPELGNYIYLRSRGDGECGYRSLVTGLLHSDCIAHDRIDDFQASIQAAFDHLSESWDALPFGEQEKKLFSTSTDEAIAKLKNIKDLNTTERMKLLQDNEFLAPFIALVRCLTVAETKRMEGEKVEEKETALTKQVTTIVNNFCKEMALTEEGRQNFRYAMENYSLSDLLGGAALPDNPGYTEQNLLKDQFKGIVQQAHLVNPKELNQLSLLIKKKNEFTNQLGILNSSMMPLIDLGIEQPEFLMRKAIRRQADSDNANFWATPSDFIALGYALNRNIGVIQKVGNDVGRIQQSFSDRPTDFVGLNLSGSHFNVLVPPV